MSLGSHIEELKKKHQDLSAKVDQAQRAPGVSTLDVAQMKKKKLKLKEEIARLSGT
ncbi:YdcH family protein [Roseovarius sp. D0-M9]|uniref:YdcH family protein n=1 Tax=Roseovarius sp. D0-M9 TaxID=3127117 RepID=UPI00300FB993